MCSDRGYLLTTQAFKMGKNDSPRTSLSSLDFPEPDNVPSYSDRFSDVIDKALKEIQKEPEELAIAHKLFNDLKAKYEADNELEKELQRSSRKKEYRNKISPYSTGSSTPAFSGRSSEYSLEQTSDENSTICKLCSRKLCSRYALRKHIEKIHPSGEKIEVTFKCPDCDKILASKQGLRAHMRRHSGVDQFQCTECEKRYMYTNELRKHMIRVHKWYPEEVQDLSLFKINPDVPSDNSDREGDDDNDDDDEDSLILQALSSYSRPNSEEFSLDITLYSKSFKKGPSRAQFGQPG
uniref:C2H2-type domain-containing protein n=1 Tax=Panagrolaimus sp. JU765 TaxID=591449 RepID=A0AC34QRA6_9BILA